MKTVHVAVGVILQQNQVLIARRHAHQHQGGLWEFPGGKVEAGETTATALARELREEVNLQLPAAVFTPLLKIPFQYPDKQVLLDVYRADISAEQAAAVQGNEGQAIRWVALSELGQYEFPAANAPITALLKN